MAESGKMILSIIAIIIVAILILGTLFLYFLLWAPSSYTATVEMNVKIESNSTPWSSVVPLPLSKANVSLFEVSDFSIGQGSPVLNIEHINNQPFLIIRSNGTEIEIHAIKKLKDINLINASGGYIDNMLSGQITVSGNRISVPCYLIEGDSAYINIYYKLSLKGFLYGNYSDFTFNNNINQGIGRIEGVNTKWSTE